MGRFELRGGDYTPDQIDGVVRNPRTHQNDPEESLIIELSPKTADSYLEIDHLGRNGRNGRKVE